MNKALSLFLLSVLLLPAAGLAQHLKFVEADGALTLFDQDRPVFSYQKMTKSLQGQYPRANYVHPLYSLAGDSLTEDFPADHPHHRGVFWTWHQLYVGEKRVGDPWFCEGISWEVEKPLTVVEKETALLEATVYWVSTTSIDEDPEPDTLLQEQVKITYRKPAAAYYELDFEVVMVPLQEQLSIGGSEDEKGYGGFSVRLKTPDDLRFTSKTGALTPANTAVQAGGWVDVKGSFNPEAKEPAGVVIVCEPRDLENFQGWILRKKDSMQNVAFPGRVPMLLEKPLSFKNKLIVYSGGISREEIERIYAAFAREP
ncbi:DUF6807 family protein [Cesiribacter sp. SM1]|uniref:DUF6807 family protein n=1 Tax=Cesiribacter sp. SM1 TaxID=2861196 RepID=UPI001CD78912|nr:DUF6807 family protein [Cesiribacter sp. SM1]